MRGVSEVQKNTSYLDRSAAASSIIKITILSIKGGNNNEAIKSYKRQFLNLVINNILSASKLFLLARKNKNLNQRRNNFFE